MGPENLLEEIEIGPIERWQQYGIWPSRLVAHTLVILTSILQVFLINNEFGMYSRNFERNCFNMIINGSLQHDAFSRKGGFDFDGEDFHANEFIVFNISDVQLQIASTVSNYFRLSESSVDFLTTADSDNDIAYPVIHYQVIHPDKDKDDEIEIGATSTWLQIKSVEDLGPLAPKVSKIHVSSFVHQLESIELFLRFQSHNPEQWFLSRESCVEWEYIFAYSRENGAGPFQTAIKQGSARRCTGHHPQYFISPILMLIFWLFLVCMWHSALATARITRGLRMLQLLKPVCTERGWESVTYSDKLAIVNVWVVCSLLGDICLISYASLEIVSLETEHVHTVVGEDVIGWQSFFITFLLGFGTAVELVSLNEYAEYGLVNYLFIQIMSAARWDVLRLVLGVFPMMMGYAIFGMVIYGDKVSRFGSLERSFATLFGLALGDETMVTFLDLMNCHGVSWFVTLPYLFSFVLVFYFVVGMSIISVVEEAFITQGLWLLETKHGDMPDIIRMSSGVTLGVSNETAALLQNTTPRGQRIIPST